MPEEKRYLTRVLDSLDNAFADFDTDTVLLDLPHMRNRKPEAIKRYLEVRLLQFKKLLGWLVTTSKGIIQRQEDILSAAIRSAIISPCADAASLAFFSVSALPPPHLRKGRIRAVSKSTTAAGWRGMPGVPAFRH